MTDAVKELKHAESLLVPKAMCGGRPEDNKTGTVNKPPPPATASIKPAIKPTRDNVTNKWGSEKSSNIVDKMALEQLKCWMVNIIGVRVT